MGLSPKAVNQHTFATKAELRALAASAPGAHVHAAGDITSGVVATARLGSGVADATTFLRGDQTYAVPAGGGGGLTHPQIMSRVSLRF